MTARFLEKRSGTRAVAMTDGRRTIDLI